MEKHLMDLDTRMALITRGLQEVVDETSLRALLSLKPSPVIYWGTAVTGKPHMGYFVAANKIADFLEAGCRVKILIADMHGFLDSSTHRGDWALLDRRYDYYNVVIRAMLRAAGVMETSGLEFVRGTSFQMSADYMLDVYRLATLTTVDSAAHAGADVVKRGAASLHLASLLYPILQALDEQYLDADAQFGGMDQRKIFMFARGGLPHLGYAKRVHLLAPLVPGLGKSGKMSSSEPSSKIGLEDDDDTIRKKIAGAFCMDRNPDSTALVPLLRLVVWPYLQRIGNQRQIAVGSLLADSVDEVAAAFAEGRVSSLELKQAVADGLVNLARPLREALRSPELIQIARLAYPEDRGKGADAGPVAAAVTAASVAALDLRVGAVKEANAIDERAMRVVLHLGDALGDRIAVFQTQGTQIALPQPGDRLVVLLNGPRHPYRGVDSEVAVVLAKIVAEGCDRRPGLEYLSPHPPGGLANDQDTAPLAAGAPLLWATPDARELPPQIEETLPKRRLARILSRCSLDCGGRLVCSEGGGVVATCRGGWDVGIGRESEAGDGATIEI